MSAHAKKLEKLALNGYAVVVYHMMSDQWLGQFGDTIFRLKSIYKLEPYLEPGINHGLGPIEKVVKMVHIKQTGTVIVTPKDTPVETTIAKLHVAVICPSCNLIMPIVDGKYCVCSDERCATRGVKWAMPTTELAKYQPK